MSSSSSSSRCNGRRETVGVPNRCWCGAKLTTFGSKTKENLFRRFYICKIGVQRQNEDHLFKWVDEAIIDEINIVDVNQRQQQAEFASFMKATTEAIESQGKCLDEAIFDMKCRLEEQRTLITEGLASATKENATATIEDGLASSNLASAVAKTQTPLLNFAACGIVFGTLAFLYAKLSN
ncbi:unnamed protein product [Eruca vesicaria subsp. sativa]|uniref:GRF-type domain-containing protein n=1 Tax=Eruca vesicaria subsp. sativa TaxID=29727 RepID=A0ABC8JD23_ERUVS|nr:unnamed protein product [Eruca vesicaria subsp. sativa]